LDCRVKPGNGKQEAVPVSGRIVPRISIVVLATLLAVIALDPASAAQKRRAHHPPQRAARSQPLIACTVLGCAPVRPGCGVAEGRTWSGMPTGGDVVVCPPGVAPFR
jgi:hypothetical protein